jgi:hypothetical protein
MAPASPLSRGKEIWIQDCKTHIQFLHKTMRLDASKRCEDSPQPTTHEDYSHMISRSKIKIIVANNWIWNHHILIMVANFLGDLYYNGDGYNYGGNWRWNGWTMLMDLLRCGVDGSNRWRLCLVANGSLFGIESFTKLIGFDLGNAATRSMGRRYGWGLPVLVSAKPSATSFWSLVNFAALVTRFSSVIAGPFLLWRDFLHTI